MGLNELKPGEYGYIDNIFCDEKLTKRLLSLGCTKGTEVKVKVVAPFGDPIVVNVRGFNLAIRKKDAKFIEVTATENINAQTVNSKEAFNDYSSISG